MEMRILSELSRWVLYDSELRAQWGDERWREVFEACGSPREWGDFVRAHRSDLILGTLEERFERIATQVLAERRVRTPVAVGLSD